MNCPICLEKGEIVEMEQVEGVISRTTDPMHDDETGKWLECPKCGHQEDLIEDEQE